MTEKKIEKRSLGRGLSALMADVNLDASDRGGQASRRPDVTVPVEKLVPNPLQPRRDFDPDSLADLAASLRQKGVIQPLVVRPIANSDQYEIVAGERRWRAAQLAELHSVPVVVRDFNDAEVLEIAKIENIQRSDLNAIEEALGFRQLMDRFGHTQERLAEAMSKSRSHIANLLRLLTLPDDVQHLVRTAKLSAGHARALINSGNASEFARQVVAKSLSVRDTERLVRESAGKSAAGRATAQRGESEVDADTRAIEADLSANLQMSVRIQHERGGDKGLLSIRYNSLEDLDLLCQTLSVMRRDLAV